jgi:hypothetical protein
MFLRSKRASERQSLASSLEDVDGYVGLAVDAGGEVLGGAGGNGGVALDDPGYDSAEGFDAERERRYVEQEEIVGGGVVSAGEYLRLHGGAKGYDFVGVEFSVELLVAGFEVEELGDERADGRDAGAAADHDDFIDLVGRKLRVFEGLANGGGGAFDDRSDELVELVASDFAEVLFARWQVDHESSSVCR